MGIRKDRTVNRLCDIYMTWARETYRERSGKAAKEIIHLRRAIAEIQAAGFGELPAEKFRPSHLLKIQDRLCQIRTPDRPNGYARLWINDQIVRIKRIFKWGVSRDLLSPSVFEGLRSIGGVRNGRGGREPKKVRPVSMEHVQAIMEIVSSEVRAMIELQLYTGCRPGEICSMKTIEIHREGDGSWVYRPGAHKRQFHDYDREVFLGPRCQKILEFMMGYRPLRIFRLSPDGYRKAIRRACKKAGIPVWTPNQLRHTVATRIRREHGIEMARVVLGHTSPNMTAIYAEADRQKAKDLATQLG